MADVLRISLSPEKTDDRFARFRLIPWWDQKKLAATKVVVIGAGALGNEIIKNLALLGIGNVFIADLDTIENSNLSRSVLYRSNDNGRRKAEVASESAKNIYPDMHTHWFAGNIVYDLGLGVYRWADIVIGGLDNREARLAINQSCYKVNRPWIDGAIEQLNGVARMFVPPDGPCYECTMSKRDWELLEMRRSCNLLTREEMETGKVPTTPTTASVIAGIQVQEAVKYLHGKPTLAGKGFIFNGLDHDSYTVEYVRKEECYSHESFSPVTVLKQGVNEVTLAMLLAQARKMVGPDAVIEFNNDILRSLRCVKCSSEEELFMSLGKVTQKQGRCPKCGEMRDIQTLHSISGRESFLERTFGQIGVPPFDIVAARSGEKQVFFEFGGDAAQVLGPLHQQGAKTWASPESVKK